MLMPRQKTPNLKLQTLDHGAFDLSNDGSERGTVVCFYRGLHCPICATYLTELEKRTADFAERGVKTIAISSDGGASWGPVKLDPTLIEPVCQASVFQNQKKNCELIKAAATANFKNGKGIGVLAILTSSSTCC